ncbi:MAG: HD domain-containing protein [Candidatus Aenigmatarchaeota archaeon]
MNKKTILRETNNFMRKNVPKSRITKQGSDKHYLKHVLGARKYGLHLAKNCDGDKFVIEMAALLHDIGADAGEDHENKSTELSIKFLSRYDIPDEIKMRILNCIKRHGFGSKAKSIEEQIIQDADGIIFVKDTFKFFFEKRLQKMSIEEAKKATIEKINVMKNKIRTKKAVRIANPFFTNSIKYIKSV